MAIEQNKIAEKSKTQPIVLFDGLCHFCDHSVQFILKRNSGKNLLFSSLQSESVKEFLSDKPNEFQSIDSILYVYQNKIFTKSSAALKIAKELNAAWFLLSVFWIVPKFIRDFFYDIIAKNRYQWFGKKEFCSIPSKEEKDRFIF